MVINGKNRWALHVGEVLRYMVRLVQRGEHDSLGGQGYSVAKMGHDRLRGCPVFLGNATGLGQSQGGGRQIKEEAGEEAEEAGRA